MKRPTLKRSARLALDGLRKKQRLEEAPVPSLIGKDWADEYSNLEHMVDTPMGRTVLKGLKKKGADINFLCEEVCSAAVEEGSTRFQTRVMSQIRKESRFHARLAGDLPKVTKVRLPIQVRKKVLYRNFRVLVRAEYICSPHVLWLLYVCISSV